MRACWRFSSSLLVSLGVASLAVALAAWLGASIGWQAAAAFAAIIGHVFTIWLRFRGGKGVATGCGAYLALSPPALLTALVVFLLILLPTRYISAASIGATALFPLLARRCFQDGVSSPSMHSF